MIKDLVLNVKDFIEQYDLVPSTGKILVAVSGGKDSSVLLYILKKLYPRRVYAATFNNHAPNFNHHLNNIRKLTSSLNVKLNVISLKEITGKTLNEIWLKNKGLNHCHICGVLRRYYLNIYARKENYKILATGHNRDDIVQAFFMNLFRNKPELNARLGPISGIHKNKKFVRKIKPLYLISEKELLEASKILKLPIYDFQCPYAISSYRFSLKHLLWDYEKKDKYFQDKAIRFLLEIMPELKLRYSNHKFSYCKICGEPSSAEICNACRILRNNK
jgi:uncharacterized protein (TIGR00269 family)